MMNMLYFNLFKYSLNTEIGLDTDVFVCLKSSQFAFVYIVCMEPTCIEQLQTSVAEISVQISVSVTLPFVNANDACCLYIHSLAQGTTVQIFNSIHITNIVWPILRICIVYRAYMYRTVANICAEICIRISVSVTLSFEHNDACCLYTP